MTFTIRLRGVVCAHHVWTVVQVFAIVQNSAAAAAKLQFDTAVQEMTDSTENIVAIDHASRPDDTVVPLGWPFIRTPIVIAPHCERLRPLQIRPVRQLPRPRPHT